MNPLENQTLNTTAKYVQYCNKRTILALSCENRCIWELEILAKARWVESNPMAAGRQEAAGTSKSSEWPCQLRWLWQGRIWGICKAATSEMSAESHFRAQKVTSVDIAAEIRFSLGNPRGFVRRQWRACATPPWRRSLRAGFQQPGWGRSVFWEGGHVPEKKKWPHFFWTWPGQCSPASFWENPWFVCQLWTQSCSPSF